MDHDDRLNRADPRRVAQWPGWHDPQHCFEEFSSRSHPFWLDTARGDGWSLLGAEPSQIFCSKGSRISIITPNGVEMYEGNPFDVLNDELEKRQSSQPGEFPLGGAIGYFGYDLKNFVETLPSSAVDDVGLPDCWFGFYDNLLAFDHRHQAVYEVGDTKETRGWPATHPKWHGGNNELRSNFTRAGYHAAVLRAKEYIAAGDVYQVNLSQRFQCGAPASAPEIYRALRQVSPAAYCAYLDIGEAQILSSSPECFLKLRGRDVVTRPIKGTRRRVENPEQDRLAAEELLRAPKDNAELVMITDLERNDLGRVCEFGSVRVSELARVESYATVHHLVATVNGRLRPEISHVDCVRACFPGGSITGAPKIRAIEIIDELEPQARGVYTGAIGFLGYNGISHFNIAIRTIVQAGGQLTFHAGGGIVADSEPDAEYDETLAKAQGIINALDQIRLRQRPVCP